MTTLNKAVTAGAELVQKLGELSETVQTNKVLNVIDTEGLVVLDKADSKRKKYLRIIGFVFTIGASICTIGFFMLNTIVLYTSDTNNNNNSTNT